MSNTNINQGFKTFEINLDNLSPKQKELQLKFLECRRHKGGCQCYLTGENPRKICKKEKKLSKSWIKEREPQGPVPTCNECEIPPFLRDCPSSN